jgi:hypothetical protein
MIFDFIRLNQMSTWEKSSLCLGVGLGDLAGEGFNSREKKGSNAEMCVGARKM